MKIFYSEKHALHNPSFEVFDGGVRTPYLETPSRMERIRSALEQEAWSEILPPVPFGLQPILTVHTADYVEFLQSAYTEWQKEKTEYEKEALLPATFPPRGWSHRPQSLLGKAGYYTMDLSAPILAGTFEAAKSSVDCALSGAQAIAAGESAAFALCRPPGHHAGRETCGGYCYFNNAAIAANWLSATEKVAVLDIDYHAGNGTQDIFYQRADVLTISIHADPDFCYPHFSGYAEETGAGPGAGQHRNFPMPAGTGDEEYLAVLDEAIILIRAFQPKYLVVSVGLDLYVGDPLGTFEITSNGIASIGSRIYSLELPTLIVMEGGYDQANLGVNLVGLLRNFT
jgi:acetoin utilization deacetylase AcuC-like enzyme